MKLTLMLSILAVANAYCPNGCSGHGSCGANGEFQLHREIFI